MEISPIKVLCVFSAPPLLVSQSLLPKELQKFNSLKSKSSALFVIVRLKSIWINFDIKFSSNFLNSHSPEKIRMFLQWSEGEELENGISLIIFRSHQIIHHVQ
jgi:hypothetical protein